MVGGDGVVLFGKTSTGFDRQAAIAWDVPQFDDLLVSALADGKGAVMVLFDGADQTYRREENIPKLSAIDRPRFVKRKLEMAFPAYSIRASMEMKPDTGKKSRSSSNRPPAYLFAALSDPSQLDKIGEAILEADVPVAGFGLLPVEASGLMRELSKELFKDSKKRSRWFLLAGQHETGGLRQVVIKDGNLALTRLTPISEGAGSGAGWAEEASRELQATMTYISRFGYTSEDGLDLVIVCGEVEKEFFDPRMISSTNFKCLNVRDALAVLGVDAPNLDKTNFSDALHAAWVARNRLRLPVRVPGIHKVQGPRFLARAAAVCLAVGCIGLLGLAGHAYWGYMTTASEVDQKKNHMALLEREYTEEAKVFDGLPIKPNAVRAGMQFREDLQKNSPQTSTFLSMMREVLGRDVLIQELNFAHKPTPSLGLPDKNASSKLGSSLGGAAVEEKGRGILQVDFKFTLPDSMTLEQKVLRAEQLAEHLRVAFKGYRVVVVSQFGKVVANGKFEGVMGAADGGSGLPSDANFAEIVMEGDPL